MRVFINGFGRIGRSVLRAYLLSPEKWPEMEIIGINDIAAAEMRAYLFEYDSVFGPWRGQVGLEGGALVVDGRRVPLHRTAEQRYQHSHTGGHRTQSYRDSAARNHAAHFRS